MTKLPRPPKRAKKRRNRGALGDEIGSILNPSSDVATILETVLGADKTRDALRAIRRSRLHLLSRDGVVFERSDVQPPNTWKERRMSALLLDILQRASASGRAWTSKLFRGHSKRLNGDGELEHMPARSAGGQAARLGVSPREIERYLEVFKAAGILDVWQGPSDAPRAFRGEAYAYAVYQWIGPVPNAVAVRLAQWWGRSGRALKAGAAPDVAARCEDDPRAPLSAAADALADKLLRASLDAVAVRLAPS